MTHIGPIKVKNTLLCDDIRHEVNNKHTLVGIYSGDILLPLVPAELLLAIYVDMEAPAGAHDLEVRLRGPGKDGAIFKASIEMETTGSASLATPRVQIHMENEGVFRIDARVSGGRWSNILKKKVLLRDRSNASEPPPGQSVSVAQETVKPTAQRRRARRRS